MSRPMGDEERRRFMMEGTRTGKLATVRRDASPHVAPIWFVLDGDDIVLMTGARTTKGRNIRRDPRVSLAVDDERPPFSYVRVDGTAEVSEDPDDMLAWSTRIADRYMGPELAEGFGRRNAVPGELLVRIRPRRIHSEAGVAD
jgi:PPOX class probable F420-dependent enzyme